MVLSVSDVPYGRRRRRVSPALVAGGVLGAALFLAAGCGTAQSPANPPATATSTASSSTAAATAPSATPAAAASSASATSSTGAATSSSIPKTGLNPALPVAGGALALLGAAVVVSGWRRLRGASR